MKYLLSPVESALYDTLGEQKVTVEKNLPTIMIMDLLSIPDGSALSQVRDSLPLDLQVLDNQGELYYSVDSATYPETTLKFYKDKAC